MPGVIAADLGELAVRVVEAVERSLELDGARVPVAPTDGVAHDVAFSAVTSEASGVARVGRR